MERKTMHITQNVEKIRTLYDGTLRNFVSYFQSVTTVGVVITARTPQEAEELAKLKMADGQFVSGIFNQSPYTLSATEEWQPEFSKNHRVSFDDDIITKIAVKLNKQPDELSANDCLQYIKQTLDASPA
jgi:hypothetical protein